MKDRAYYATSDTDRSYKWLKNFLSGSISVLGRGVQSSTYIFLWLNSSTRLDLKPERGGETTSNLKCVISSCSSQHTVFLEVPSRRNIADSPASLAVLFDISDYNFTKINANVFNGEVPATNSINFG